MGFAVRTQRYRYVEWAAGDRGVELYDYDEDPLEYANLAGREEYAQLVRRLRAELERIRGLSPP